MLSLAASLQGAAPIDLPPPQQGGRSSPRTAVAAAATAALSWAQLAATHHGAGGGLQGTGLPGAPVSLPLHVEGWTRGTQGLLLRRSDGAQQVSLEHGMQVLLDPGRDLMLCWGLASAGASREEVSPKDGNPGATLLEGMAALRSLLAALVPATCGNVALAARSAPALGQQPLGRLSLARSTLHTRTLGT
jgi:hypothetical protein